MKYLLPLFCFFCASTQALSEDVPVQNVGTRLYWVQPSTFPQEYAKSLPQQLRSWPCELQFDVRKYFARNGVGLLSTEDAIYQPSSRVLIVRARVAILDSVQATLGSICFFASNGGPSCVRVEVALVEFSTAKDSELNGEAPYGEVRKAAGDSWHVLNRSVVMTKPEERTLLVSKIGQQGKTDTTLATGQLKEEDKVGPLLEGESGATFEVRPTLSQEGRTAVVDLVYHYRVQGPEAIDWETTTSASVNVGVPRVLQLNSAPPGADGSKPAKLRALVVRVDAIYDYGADPKAEPPPAGAAVIPAPKP